MRKLTMLLQALVFIPLVFLIGCMSLSIDEEKMIPDAFTIAAKHPFSVSIKATGIQEQINGGEVNISNESLYHALSESITRSQVFSRVERGKADYVLTVTIMMFDLKPGPPIDFNVNIEAGWKLTRSDTGEVIWQSPVRSSYTATIRKAVEGVMRDNIRVGVANISRLDSIK